MFEAVVLIIVVLMLITGISSHSSNARDKQLRQEQKDELVEKMLNDYR